jgi:hypothetical protein
MDSHFLMRYPQDMKDACRILFNEKMHGSFFAKIQYNKKRDQQIVDISDLDEIYGAYKNEIGLISVYLCKHASNNKIDETNTYIVDCIDGKLCIAVRRDSQKKYRFAVFPIIIPNDTDPI